MDSRSLVTRRVVLGALAAGTPVVGTFLLPSSLHGAMAAAAHAGEHLGDAASLLDEASSRSHRKSGHPPDTNRNEKSRARPPLPLVMLDPGHGGKDPGAIGVSGTYEKHVALAAAQELRHMLEASGKYRVELTRSRDAFVPLNERVARAQANRAALFVSMHADALSDHRVRGASVYTLGHTASDAQTAALARTENSADRFLGGAWHDASPEVAQILASLVRQETHAGSVRIARTLVGSLDRDLPLLPNPERHAGFVVLKSADVPSVLVEMGFMSNPKDEAALRRPDHRHIVAMAMKRAVDSYFAAATMADAQLGTIGGLLHG